MSPLDMILGLSLTGAGVVGLIFHVGYEMGRRSRR